MDWKNFAFRLLGLILMTVVGFYIFVFTFHGMVMLNLFPPDAIDKAIGSTLTRNSMYVCVFTFLLGFISLFFKGDWRNVLYFSPLYAPALFAVVYTVIQ